MKRTALILSLLFACACSGGSEKPDETPTDDDAQTAVDLAACEEAAEQVRAEIAALRGTDVAADYGELAHLYREFLNTRRTWEAEDSVCRVEGADVTARARVYDAVARQLADVDDEFTVRATRQLGGGDIENARRFIRTRFSTGREVPSELQGVAHEVGQAYNAGLLKAFQENEMYGKVDDTRTTCIFKRTEFDPQKEEITPGFASVFEGSGDVHALCRLPLPASKYGGDPNGKIKILLDDDINPKDEVIYEGDLGPIAKWKNTQFFTARFRIPQGIANEDRAAYFHVSIKIERPELGDEYPVSNGFFWFR